MAAVTMGSDGFYHPLTEDDVRDLILLAREQRKIIRVRGSAHSTGAAIFTSCDDPGLYPKTEPPADGNINVMLDQMYAILNWDDEKMQVTAQGGCHIGLDPSDPTHTSTLENSLFYQVNERGWALPDSGGITHQTIAGFLSTGSSGSSLHHSVNRQLVALRLIDGLGNVIDLDQSDERFFAAGVSLGLLGIIVRATFQCVPTFNIMGQQATTTTADCAIDIFGAGSNGKPSLVQFFQNTDHTRLMWWPQKGVDRMEVWQATVIAPADGFKADPYQEFPKIGGSTENAEKLARDVFEMTSNWAVPGLKGDITRGLLETIYPTIIKIFASEETVTFSDVWWHGLPMDNAADDDLVPTHFTELWIPIEQTQQVMVTLRDLYQKNGIRATGTYSCEIYPTPSSQFWMSAAYERDVVKVDVFWYGNNAGNPIELYYPQFWDALKPFNFRPHWGKYLPFTYDKPAEWLEYIKAQYPQWDNFMNLRAAMDPDQIFVSDYWRTQLGITSLG